MRPKRQLFTIIIGLLCFSCFLTVSPPEIKAESVPQWGEFRYAARRVNIRSDRTTDSSIVETLNPGDKVKVDFLENNWYAVFDPQETLRSEKAAIGYGFALLFKPVQAEVEETKAPMPVAEIETRKVTVVKETQDQNWGKIMYTVARVNVRSLRSTSGSIVSKLNLGDKVKADFLQNNWYAVFDPDETVRDEKSAIGYVYYTLLTSDYSPPPTKEETSTSSVAKVEPPKKDWGEIKYVHSNVNVRSERGTSGKVVTKLEPGDKVKADFLQNNWYAVFEPNETVRDEKSAIGYVYYTLLTSDYSPPPTKEETSTSSVAKVEPPKKDWGEIKYAHSRINVRSERSTKGRVVTKLEPGDKVKADFLKDGWYAVFKESESKRDEKAAMGFVYAKILSSEPFVIDIIEEQETKTVKPEVKDVKPPSDKVEILNAVKTTEIKSTRSADGYTIARLEAGDRVKVSFLKDNWYAAFALDETLIKEESAIGYIYAPMLYKKSEAAPIPKPSNKADKKDEVKWGEIRYLTQSTDIRGSRSKDGYIVTTIQAGETVKVDFLKDDWYAVFDKSETLQDEKNAIGYIYAPIVKPIIIATPEERKDWGEIRYAHGDVKLMNSRELSASVITRLTPGDKVKVDFLQKGWFAVFSPEETIRDESVAIGYAAADSLDIRPWNAPLAPSLLDNKVFDKWGEIMHAASKANVRNTRSDKGEVIALLEAGDIVKADFFQNNWYAVFSPDETIRDEKLAKGYVYAPFLEKGLPKISKDVGEPKFWGKIMYVYSGVEVKSERKHDAPTVKRLVPGMGVKAEFLKDGWYAIFDLNQRYIEESRAIGYVPEPLLYMKPPSKEKLEKELPGRWGEIRYIHSIVEVRSLRDERSFLIKKLNPGEKIKVDFFKDGWYAVFNITDPEREEESAIGYVRASMLSYYPLPEDAVADAVAVKRPETASEPPFPLPDQYTLDEAIARVLDQRLQRNLEGTKNFSTKDIVYLGLTAESALISWDEQKDTSDGGIGNLNIGTRIFATYKKYLLSVGYNKGEWTGTGEQYILSSTGSSTTAYKIFDSNYKNREIDIKGRLLLDASDIVSPYFIGGISLISSENTKIIQDDSETYRWTETNELVKTIQSDYITLSIGLGMIMPLREKIGIEGDFRLAYTKGKKDILADDEDGYSGSGLGYILSVGGYWNMKPDWKIMVLAEFSRFDCGYDIGSLAKTDISLNLGYYLDDFRLREIIERLK